MTPNFQQTAREIVQSINKEAWVGGSPIEIIASALQSLQAQHDREVEELREVISKTKTETIYPCDWDDKLQAGGYDSYDDCFEEGQNLRESRILSAFDLTRSEQTKGRGITE